MDTSEGYLLGLNIQLQQEEKWHYIQTIIKYFELNEKATLPETILLRNFFSVLFEYLKLKEKLVKFIGDFTF